MILLWLSGLNCLADDRDTSAFRNLTHHFGVDFRPSYIMPTHGFYSGWNSLGKPLRAGGSAHIKYSFTFSEDSRFGRIYPSAYQGIGVSANTFFAHDILGTPTAVYLFQGAPVMRLMPGLTFDYEWNFGLSWGWKAYDVDSEEMVVGSKVNAYINVGLFLSYDIGDCWKLTAGPEYTHFSNGDTKFPNGGANTVNFRIGMTGNFGKSGSGKTIADMLDLSKRYLTWDIIAYGAWRADRMITDGRLFIINKAFPIAGLNINPLYHFSNSLSAGASLDLMYDASADLIAHSESDDKIEYTSPSFLSQCAAGVSLRGEVSMPVFSINLGLGCNFQHRGTDLKGIYGIFALKTHLTDRCFIHIGYRLSSKSYSHNLMLGLGLRLSSERFRKDR